MKNSLRYLLFLLFAGLSMAPLMGQTLQSAGTSINNPGVRTVSSTSSFAARGPSTCGPDTVAYGQAKATGLPAITLNAASSADKLGQYFDCPQPIVISSFSFFSWQSDINSSTPVTLTGRIYNAGLDSLPIGNAIATGTVVIDTNFYAGNIALLRKTVTFNNPITVTTPYVLAVESVSGTSVAVVCNSWTATPADGLQEWLGMASLATTGWLHGYGLNVGVGTPFDCDVMLQPHVTYDISSNFTATPSCFTSSTPVTFTNTSSPILFNRMYNVAPATGNTDLSFEWNYGDSSPLDTIVDTTHVYSASGSYSVTLTSTIFGWSGNCSDDTVFVIGSTPPVAAYSSAGTALMYQFTNSTSGGATSYLWDFGDGNTSTATDPMHTYLAPGTYTVCLTATSSCGSDSTCSSITVTNCPAPTPGFSAVANQLSVNFTDASVGTGTLSYLWDFGDGTTDTQQSPIHGYASPGTYTVCLTVTDNCGSDSTCSNVTVSCPAPSSGFTFVTNNRDVTFTNTSIGGTTYSWTFGDGNSDIGTSPSHTYAADGAYEVCLIASNNCGADTICDTVNVMIIGLEEGIAGKVALYPNPTTSILNVELDLTTSEEITIEVYNLLGDRLLLSQAGLVQRKTVHLDLSQIESGIYLVRVNGANGMINRKIQLLR